jgi:phage-related protein
MSTLSGWSFRFLNAAVQAEADALPSDMRSRLYRYSELIEDEGLDALPYGWVKPLGSKLWELRMTGRDGIARAIYLTATGKRVVVLRVFIKKTEKTPLEELRIARERAEEVT